MFDVSLANLTHEMVHRTKKKKKKKQRILHPQRTVKGKQTYLKYEMTDTSFTIEDLTRFLYVVSSIVLYLAGDDLG